MSRYPIDGERGRPIKTLRVLNGRPLKARRSPRTGYWTKVAVLVLASLVILFWVFVLGFELKEWLEQS